MSLVFTPRVGRPFRLWASFLHLFTDLGRGLCWCSLLCALIVLVKTEQPFPRMLSCELTSVTRDEHGHGLQRSPKQKTGAVRTTTTGVASPSIHMHELPDVLKLPLKTDMSADRFLASEENRVRNPAPGLKPLSGGLVGELIPWHGSSRAASQSSH